MITLHSIEKELVKPRLSSTQKKAIAAFQRFYIGRYVIILHVFPNNTVSKIIYRNIETQISGEFLTRDLPYWENSVYIETDKIDWNIITIINVS